MTPDSSSKTRLADQPARPAENGSPSMDSPAGGTAQSASLNIEVSPVPMTAPDEVRPSGVTSHPALPMNFESDRTVISKQTPVAVAIPAAQLPPIEMGRVLEGQRLGHYELREFVGGGGMGAVFRAHDSMLDRTVAVKVLSQSQSNDEETLKRFKNEAQSAARLDHENIGRVHYVGDDKGWHYIVFEFIEGTNLRELVERDGPLSVAAAVSFTLQIADALAHAAERDVVHRDIKPSNVLITPNGRAKLVDMGLARLHQVEHSGNDLTASGVTLGTFDYISPEQARDPRNADVRSDIYSLGCTLYYVLTGRPPFPEGTVLQKLLQHQSEEPTDPRGVRSDLPEELLRILRRMLAKSPKDRYQRPVVLMRDLLSLATKYNLPVAATISPLNKPTGELGSAFIVRHLPWLAPVGALLLAALVVAVINRTDPAEATPPPIRRPALGRPAPDKPDTTRHEDFAAAKNDGGSSANNNRARAAKTGIEGQEKEPTTRDANPDKTASADNSGETTPLADDAGPRSADGVKPAGENSRGATAAPRDAASPVPKTFVAPLVQDLVKPAVPGGFQNWLERRLAFLAGSPMSAGERVRIPLLHDDGNGSAQSTGAEPAVVAVKSDASSPSLPDRKGALVVSRSHDGPGEFGSLAEACQRAKSGDVIELRFNGRLDSRPMNAAGQRLTVRAGDGFAPIVRFQPRESDLTQSRSMIALSGGQLTLISVQIEWDLERDYTSESMALAEIRPGESLRLDNCALTIRNSSETGSAYHPDVAFLDVRALPGPGIMASKEGPMMRTAAVVQLKNCIARGEAAFLRANDLQPAQITWENGLLVTSEKLLMAAGGPSEPKPQGQLQLDLRHLTAYVQGGFAELRTSHDAPQQLPLEVNASDCIFLGKSLAPLIDQVGVDEAEDLRKHLAWSGDRNFYEGFALLWRMGGPGGTNTAGQMTLADWQGFWGPHEIRPSGDRITWRKLPPTDRPVHRQLPTDYALAGDENSRNAAPDGLDAGVQIDQLPIMKD